MDRVDDDMKQSLGVEEAMVGEQLVYILDFAGLVVLNVGKAIVVV
jgi:hypothetical protein